MIYDDVPHILDTKVRRMFFIVHKRVGRGVFA
jgi:hypothetical protein